MKRLDEIEARTNAATEGPWRLGHFGPDDPDVNAILSSGGTFVVSTDGDYPIRRPDAEFISNSRRDIPDMLGFIRDLITLIEDKESSFSRKIATDLEGNPFPALVSADEIRRLLNRHLGGYIES